jgi:hypothetical protein
MDTFKDNQYFIYNDTTLIEIDSGILSFITLLPIRSVIKENWKEKKSEVDKNYKEGLIKSLLNPLQPFEIPSRWNKKGRLGTTYKIIHLYEKNTKIQTGLINDTEVSERIRSSGKDKRILKPAEQFLKSKQDLKAETIANYPHYEKTDFLVIKTMHLHESVMKGESTIGEDGHPIIVPGIKVAKKSNLKEHFKDYTEKKHKADKEALLKLYMEHQRTYSSISDNYLESSVIVTANNIIEWFSKISLSTYKTSVEDLNCLNNNVLNYSPEYSSKSTLIYPQRNEFPIKIINYYPEKVTIYSRTTDETKTYKLSEGESVDYKKDSKKIEIRKIFYQNGIRQENDILDTQIIDSKFIIEDKDRVQTTKSFFLTEVPPHIESDISMKISDNVLQDIKPDFFVQQIEVFKLPMKQQQTVLTDKINRLKLISGIVPSMGTLIYDKSIVLDKIEGLTAARTQITESPIISTRYSFGYRKESISESDNSKLKLRLKSYGIEDFTEATQSLNKTILPWTYNPYIIDKEARSTTLELSQDELSNLINLKQGQGEMSFSKPRTDGAVAPIKKSCFFVKTEDEVIGIDIFKGPEKFNGLIIAPSGSGKSFFAVNMLDGFISANENNTVWILDRGGSFTRFTETYGGVNKELSPSSDNNSVNPFGLSLSLVLMVKLHYFEEYLNERTINKVTGKKERKNVLTPDIHSEINNIIRLLKIISINTTSNFYPVEDEDGVSGYNRLPESARQKQDIFKYMVDEEDGKLELLEISSEFFITQIQDTFAVLSSIVTSMLATKDKPEFVKTSFVSEAPKVLRKLFLNAYEKEIRDKIFITDYNRTTGEENASFDFDTVIPTGYENPLFEEIKKIEKEEKTSIKFKYEDEIVDYSGKNMYFIIEELKEEFKKFILRGDKISGQLKDEIILHLKEFDFYIDELEAGKLFNVEPPKDLSKERLVNIDLGESQDKRLTTVVPSALLMNFFKVLTSPSKKGSNKILLIDEAHAILGAEDTSGLEAIAYLFRTARKHGGGIWLISQSIGDFYQPLDERNRMLEALIKNAGWRVLLGSGHVNTKEALGFSGDSIEFARKSKDDAEKYKMIIDMDGKTINVVDLVVSATDYWNSTTHAAEKLVLDTFTLMTGSAQHGKMLASLTFNSAKDGMRKKYPSIGLLQEANPATNPDDTFNSLKLKTGKDYTEIEKQRIYGDYKTVYALISETDKAGVSIKAFKE